VCCSVLQCVAVCCSVLQCVALCCSVLQCIEVRNHQMTHEGWSRSGFENRTSQLRDESILVMCMSVCVCVCVCVC